jgi:hypothetical protein
MEEVELAPALRLIGRQALNHSVVNGAEKAVGSFDRVTLLSIALVPEHEPRKEGGRGCDDLDHSAAEAATTIGQGGNPRRQSGWPERGPNVQGTIPHDSIG